MMSESNVPPPTQVTVTNASSPQQPTVKSDPGQTPGGLSWLKINVAYFKSIPGILKLVEVELVNTGIITVLYVTAFITQLATWSGHTLLSSVYSANITAGVFGLFNTIAYAGSTFFLYQDWKGGVNPQQ
ncbi:hypothetical protein B566_EDAN003839 [Ephemera danica]|nr:hypothetical protein B566_EDAN003839 [Ephemera danica]